MDGLLDFLPLLGIRETWVIGLVLVVAILRPVGKLGWLAAGALATAAVATVAGVLRGVLPGTVMGPDADWLASALSAPVAIALAAWTLLAGLLLAAAVVRPLRWEPRTGPSAATALAFGALVVHAGAAWHMGGNAGALAARWLTGPLTGDQLAGQVGGLGAGPLTWASSWLPGAVPGLTPRAGAALLGFVAAVVVVLGAERLGRRWGNVGTARCIAAAVAWSPPLLLAHAIAPAALLATAALVWSWWALVEVWGGRHRPGRLSFVSGLLLGVSGGLAVWPLLAAPLWVRRLGRRTAGWFAVGVGAAALLTALALVPAAVGLGDAWDAAVVRPLRGGLLPAAGVAGAIVVALATFVVQRALSPTRLSAATAAVLLLAVPWWPAGGELAGPVAAMPFVLLASVAPDRPDERWPPDSAMHAADPQRVGA